MWNEPLTVVHEPNGKFRAANQLRFIVVLVFDQVLAYPLRPNHNVTLASPITAEQKRTAVLGPSHTASGGRFRFVEQSESLPREAA